MFALLLYFVPIRFRVNAFIGTQLQQMELDLLILYGLFRFSHHYRSTDNGESPEEPAKPEHPSGNRKKGRFVPPPPLTELWKRTAEYGLGVALLSLFVKQPIVSWVESFAASKTHTRCRRLDWIACLGFDDAARTALAAGAAHAAMGTGIGFIQQYVDFGRCRPCHIEVIPSFSEPRLETSLYCILDMKVGHIIAVGCQNYLLHLLKRKE